MRIQRRDIKGDIRMSQILGVGHMAYFKMVLPVFRSVLQLLASAITAAAVLTSSTALMTSGLRAGRMIPSRARHRRGRS